MKTKIMKTKINLLALFMLFAFSCENEQVGEQNQQDANSGINSPHFVSKSTAKSLAENLSFRDGKRSIESIKSNDDDKGIAQFYTINFENGGYIIMSADKRMDPIYAFSETGSFDFISNYEIEDLDTTEYPQGLLEWASVYKKITESVRNENKEPTDVINGEWDALSNGEFILLPKENEGSGLRMASDYFYKSDKEGEWGQGCGYNQVFPYAAGKCLKSDDCYKILVGCAPVAFGQLMKHHQYARNKNYDWNQIPVVGPSGKGSQLLKDIFNKFGTHVNDCSSDSYGFGSQFSAFNYFGYKATSLTDKNYGLESQLIFKKRPILVQGLRESDGAGHAFIFDGAYVKCYSSNGCQVKYSYISVNWGWDRAYNGWFKANANDEKERFKMYRKYFDVQPY